MHSDCTTLSEAIAEFAKIRACAPFRFSGVWYIANDIGGGWTAFRTKRAAAKNCGNGNIYKVKL
jgi:hypothetical protein